ncbi:hypothetical protein ABZ949_34525, partial [Micromonospora tulbaghiae]|uniref:hypothetical protein n=1 Tax=Micromonospora tulbaghiae TaxID=479978 RepID=UPI0033C01229
MRKAAEETSDSHPSERLRICLQATRALTLRVCRRMDLNVSALVWAVTLIAMIAVLLADLF